MPALFTGHQTEKMRKWIGIIIAIAAVICAVVILLIVRFNSKSRYDPPVIQGVPEQIDVEEDDDIQAVLLDGVTAVGGEDRPGQTFPVSVSIYQESGQEAQECPPGTYRLVYRCEDDSGLEAEPVESVLVVRPADREGPVIEGARDITVEVGQTVSYRSGITVTDNVDQSVQFQVDAGQVDLTQPGEYPVIYTATDSHGNETTVTVTITVTEPADGAEGAADDAPGGTPSVSVPVNITQEQLDEMADRILSQIITSGMSQLQKARAIYDYVRSHIKYVGTSDKSSWIKGAYIGFTQGRGDCFNYFACSKELLTRAGIPNIDLQRVGGTTQHYWQLINVGTGWYHFDTCPHPIGYPLDSFMLTEAEVREYTERCSSVRKNYFVYDYASCPVTVVGTPEEEIPAASQPPATETPAASQPPVTQTPAASEPPAAETPAASQPPATEVSAEPAQPAGEPPMESQQPTEEETTPASDPNPLEEQPDETSGQESEMSAEGSEE